MTMKEDGGKNRRKERTIVILKSVQLFNCLRPQQRAYALPRREIEKVGSERTKKRRLCLDKLDGMCIDTKVEERECGRANETQTIRGSGLDFKHGGSCIFCVGITRFVGHGTVKLAAAIEEQRLRVTNPAERLLEKACDLLGAWSMVPVIEQDVNLWVVANDILITIYDNKAVQWALLKTGMRMPPQRARGIRGELVDERLSGADGALGDVRDTIRPSCIELLDTVPMYGSGVGGEVIDNGDADSVIRTYAQRGTRVLIIDDRNEFFHAVWTHKLVCDMPGLLNERGIACGNEEKGTDEGAEQGSTRIHGCGL